MKQRRPLVQRTPLTRKTPLRSGSAGALKSSGPVKPRRYQPSAEEEAAKKALAERSGGWCEIQAPGVCQGRAREWSHRKPKAHCPPEELWVLSNGLHACGHGNLDGCHGLVHQRPEFARSQGWVVRSKWNPASVSAVRRGFRVWLFDDGSIEPVDLSEIAESGGGVMEGQDQVRPERPDSPPPPGFERVAIRDLFSEWRVESGHQCRMVAGRPRRRCGKPAVAALNRGRNRYPEGKTDSWWHYCEDHLYGRWIENGAVMIWGIRAIDPVPSGGDAA